MNIQSNGPNRIISFIWSNSLSIFIQSILETIFIPFEYITSNSQVWFVSIAFLTQCAFYSWKGYNSDPCISEWNSFISFTHLSCHLCLFLPSWLVKFRQCPLVPPQRTFIFLAIIIIHISSWSQFFHYRTIRSCFLTFYGSFLFYLRYTLRFLFPSQELSGHTRRSNLYIQQLQEKHFQKWLSSKEMHGGCSAGNLINTLKLPIKKKKRLEKLPKFFLCKNYKTEAICGSFEDHKYPKTCYLLCFISVTQTCKGWRAVLQCKWFQSGTVPNQEQTKLGNI